MYLLIGGNSWAGTHGTIPIIGPKSLQQAESNLHAIDVVVSLIQINYSIQLESLQLQIKSDYLY